MPAALGSSAASAALLFVAVGAVGAVGLAGCCLVGGASLGWQDVPAPTTEDLRAVAEADDGTVVVAGLHGALLRQRARTWEPLATEVRADLHAVFIAPGGDVWAVGGGCVPASPDCEASVVIRVHDGVVERLRSPVAQTLRAVHGVAADDVWLVGDLYPTAEVLHWNGTSLEARAVPIDASVGLVAVVGIGPDEALLVSSMCVLRARGPSVTTMIYPMSRADDCRAPLDPEANEGEGGSFYVAQPTATGAMFLSCDSIDGGVRVTWLEGGSVHRRGCVGRGLSHPLGGWTAADGSLYVGLDSGELAHLDASACLGVGRMPFEPRAFGGGAAPIILGRDGRVMRAEVP